MSDIKLKAANGGGSISLKGPSTLGSDRDLVDTSGNINLLDSQKLNVGTDDDLEIYFDGTNNHIKGLNGSTYIGAVDNVEIRSTDSSGSNAKWMIRCHNDAEVGLYHNNTLQCQTSANGLAFPSGKGIDFSANANAGGMTSELLDDYEEGTWDVSFKGAEGGSSSFSNTGHYIKIGRVVHCTVTLSDKTNNGVGGTVEVSAPFTAGSDIQGQIWKGGDIYFYPLSTWDTYTDHLGFSPQMNAGSSIFYLSIKRKDDDRQDVMSAGNNSNISTASGMWCKFSITYWVAA